MRWFYVISAIELKLEHSREILDFGGLGRFTVRRLKYIKTRPQRTTFKTTQTSFGQNTQLLKSALHEHSVIINLYSKSFIR